MAVKIRLARHGRKARPFYHIVAADSRAPRDGKFIEKIGVYNPMTNPATVEIKFERALHWLQVGAEPTDTVRSILSKEGVMYKKHLLGGVAKGAFDEAEMEKKFQAWLDKKQKENSDAISKLDSEKQAAQKARIEAEAKVNKAREEEIAKKNSELAAAAAEAEAAANAEESEESTEEVAEDAPAAEEANEEEKA